MEQPPDLMAKVARIQEDFPNGFVLFIPPQDEKSMWVSVYRFNPKNIVVIEAIYDKIVTGKMTGGTQN